MSTSYQYDLFVIGAGSGGVRAARMSGSYGARVAIAEGKYLGGTCVNAGCIPKKLLYYASHFHEDFEDARGYGWDVTAPGFDWSTLVRNKDKEIERLNGVYDRLLTNAGVKLFRGRARVIGPHEVEVDGQRVTAERILVATGGKPRMPDIPGKELAISSDEAFHLPELPKRVVISGGGYIAVEFAGILAGLGARVTMAVRGLHLLNGFDDDIRSFLAEEMIKKGIEIKPNTEVSCLARRDDGALCVALQDGTEIEADTALFAIGRVPNVQGLGLEEVGVTLAPNGSVVVDDGFKTSVPSIYAIGDVIGRVALTPVAIAEAMALSRALFRGQPVKMDYHNIPTAVFSQPSIGTVGLTEAQAREACKKLDVYASTFRPLKHTLSGRQEKTMMKLLVDKETDKVLGVHMVGPDAGEITQGFAVALKCGATKAQFDATVGIHPTSAEELVTMREPLPDPPSS
ncbi:glutathione-disulfide reductase [Chondromyces crocatus]|uniref:Glutathione reductase n=1 Tax=Chondromyces crocatus TaxID=52 RepID=A0A0K1EQN2_CHOCO|nr:glutathione-disulfide reductase [Chondromyces crocatus]AKT43235.1 glutathione reductase [Chondromyces crocatus]